MTDWTSADTELVARFLWPETVADIPVVHVEDDGTVFITLGWNKPFHPHLNLDHCRWAYEVLFERKLMRDFRIALETELGMFTSYDDTGFRARLVARDSELYFERVIQITPLQIAFAIRQVARDQEDE